MTDTNPIPEHVFGGYPHNAQTVFAQTDPNATNAMLRENLEHQLKTRPLGMKSVKHDPTFNKRDTRKALANGWRIETQIRAGFWRTGRITMTRPRVTEEGAAFLGWSKK